MTDYIHNLIYFNQLFPITADADAASAGASEGLREPLKLVVSTQIVTKIIDFIPYLLSAILVFFVFLFLQKVIEKVAVKAMEKLKWEPAIQQLLKSLINICVIGFGIITAVDQLGINITSLIAGVGVASLAISFAAKDTVENLIGGVTIVIDKPFRVGDFIEVDGAMGTVVEITLRSIRIRTKENYIKILPTSKIINSNITNRSAGTERIVYIPVGISYDSDIDKAREIIINTIKDDSRVIPDSAKVVVTQLDDSSVNLRLNFTIKDYAQEFPMIFEYNEKIKKNLDKGGIEIPFPCRNVYLHQTEKA